jgi:hypothetical protein
MTSLADVRTICTHEASHAVCALALKQGVHSVMVSEEECRGEFRHVPKTISIGEATERLSGVDGDISFPLLKNLLVSVLSGPIAEHKQSGNALWLRDDMDKARFILDRTSLTDDQRAFVIQSALTDATRIVDKFWPCIQKLADWIYMARKLNAEEIRMAIQESGDAGLMLLGEAPRSRASEPPARDRGKVEGLRYRDWIMELAPPCQYRDHGRDLKASRPLIRDDAPFGRDSETGEAYAYRPGHRLGESRP